MYIAYLLTIIVKLQHWKPIILFINMIFYVLVKLFLIRHWIKWQRSHDKRLNLIRSDHPNNIKRVGVCIYYKESPAVHIVNIPSLAECLVCEVTIQNKKGYVHVVYRSPSQSTSEFVSFLSGLEDLISNTLCLKSQFTVVLGDLNARSPAWWSEDITTLHGTQIDSLTTTHGFKEIISDTTHILPQPSCCIYLIFTNQSRYLIERGTHPSLHPNWHHKITFFQLNQMSKLLFLIRY